ncbi:MAG: aminoacyl-histidine dipeptidase [Eubacterium sp.]|nr:aminoacyl-histidine dipeptidase [Eubacterium sp.]
MSVLNQYEPKKVFQFFEEICSIPHGSNNVKKISDYLVNFAKERNLKVRQDEAYNVIIWKDGSTGYETSAPVILQGHMDMVAVKDADCVKDMEKDGLDLEINGEFLSAKGTSLGGDDGIAVAYALAVLDDDTLAHPPIEAVFTTNEEIGMLGATALDTSDLKGKLMMNIDSEEEGVFTVSCAGGATVKCKLPYKKELISASIIELRMDGFTGGHSGIEIDKDRSNANQVMGRVLLNVFQQVGMRLIVIGGGTKDNVIANFTEAAIAVNTEAIDATKKIIEDTFAEVKAEHQISDPDMKLQLNVMDENMFESFSGAATLATVVSLANMPGGVQRMNPEITGMVQTSLNLGILKTEAEFVELTFSVRSSVESEKKFLIEKLRSLTEIFGGTVDVEGDYPGWQYQADSKLRDVMIQAYQDIYGEEPIVEGVHAGLECGIFAAKIPGLDAVSFGPMMNNIHTTQEELNIPSVERTWKLILKTLEMLK